jgi:hypothetical protein
MNGATPHYSPFTASWHAQRQLSLQRAAVSVVPIYCFILIKKFLVVGDLILSIMRYVAPAG